MRYRRSTVEDRYVVLRSASAPVDFRGRSFDMFDLRAFLELVLPGLRFPPRPSAFEYGTGTGPGACYLAARGFCVDAIDTSPAAIELARRFAIEMGLAVRFDVADITRLPPRTRRYDLVVDSFCLHNLVTDAERRRALATVRALLRPGGHFIVGTCVFEENRDYGGDIRDDRTGIVYSRLPDGTTMYDDAVRMYDGWFYLRARHARPAQLRTELETAGFGVVEQQGGRVLCARNSVAA